MSRTINSIDSKKLWLLPKSKKRVFASEEDEEAYLTRKNMVSAFLRRITKGEPTKAKDGDSSTGVATIKPYVPSFLPRKRNHILIDRTDMTAKIIGGDKTKVQKPATDSKYIKWASEFGMMFNMIALLINEKSKQDVDTSSRFSLLEID
jgi:hypothetical protein